MHCISIWKFIVLKPYLSSLLFLVPDNKTGKSVWSSYVRTLNTCLKSKVRISFVISSMWLCKIFFCIMLNKCSVPNAWVFSMQSFIFFLIVWWVMFYNVFCGRLEENQRTQRSGKECPGSYPQLDRHGLNNKLH